MLEQPLSKEELWASIDVLKNKKLSGKDGLPIEFFKAFKDILIQPLLDMWIEATEVQVLPLFLNERVIKLIHKHKEKESIKN